MSSATNPRAPVTTVSNLQKFSSPSIKPEDPMLAEIRVILQQSPSILGAALYDQMKGTSKQLVLSVRLSPKLSLGEQQKTMKSLKDDCAISKAIKDIVRSESLAGETKNVHGLDLMAPEPIAKPKPPQVTKSAPRHAPPVIDRIELELE